MSETSSYFPKTDRFLAKCQVVIGAIGMVILPYNIIAGMGYVPKLDPLFIAIENFIISLFKFF